MMAAFQRSARGGGQWGFALQSCELNRRAGLPRRNQTRRRVQGQPGAFEIRRFCWIDAQGSPASASSGSTDRCEIPASPCRVGIVPRPRSTHRRVGEPCGTACGETLAGLDRLDVASEGVSASISFRLCRENDCSSQATAADRPITAQPFAAGCALLGALQSTQPFVLCVVIDCASRTDKIK